MSLLLSVPALLAAGDAPDLPDPNDAAAWLDHEFMTRKARAAARQATGAGRPAALILGGNAHPFRPLRPLRPSPATLAAARAFRIAEPAARNSAEAELAGFPPIERRSWLRRVITAT